MCFSGELTPWEGTPGCTRQFTKSRLIPHPSDGRTGGSNDRNDCQGNIAQFGKSRFREKLSSDEGRFSQEYFVYFKKK